ncbi:MAG: shikimate kinase [Candidatus Tectomicrobia bacterium]|nr:shikimate kinase [Candidatus Tectomicrobia bacterium]
MNVVLTGLRGTGKSTLGRVLARLMGYRFRDTDRDIVRRAGMSINEIVAKHGWDHFRAVEREVVGEAAALRDYVIAAGGGALLDQESARVVKESAVVVLLVCDLPVLAARIARHSHRPSLTGQASAEAEIAQVWEQRRDHYHAVADVTYDVSAQSGNEANDLRYKAADIHRLLLRTGRFEGK